VVDQSETVVAADPAVIAGLDYWRTLSISQQPEWPDAEAVAAASAEIASLPPLVFAGEVDILRERLAKAARGEAFLLQGGDCAETFAGATAEAIRNRVKTILQMAVVLTYGASMPVIKMGRMAGQFAKPRSSDTETLDPEPHPRLHAGRVRRPAPGSQLEPRLRLQPGQPPLREAGQRDRQGHPLHAGGGSRLR
jgi:3-deoxy-D-arabino-heptulosonate 7-phosphate (DAHP) synthase class II